MSEKSDFVKNMIEQNRIKSSQNVFLINEITDQLIRLTKSEIIEWLPLMEFYDNDYIVPKRLSILLESHLEKGFVLSREQSFFAEYEGNYYFSMRFKRIAADLIAFGIIIAPINNTENKGVSLINTENAMRLFNLIRYNQTARKASENDEQNEYLTSVYESLKNEPLV